MTLPEDDQEVVETAALVRQEHRKRAELAAADSLIRQFSDTPLLLSKKISAFTDEEQRQESERNANMKAIRASQVVQSPFRKEEGIDWSIT